ncbi:amidase [Virgibacillus soli]|uniref:amidase n=1 Tax=Paracerasibacillus soli TaxID=480284 RepID=UPI0035E9C5B9
MDLQTYLTWDATEMAKQVKEKQITPKELVALSFDQMEKVNPALNAVVRNRKEKALKEAEEAKTSNLPFAGVPILLKDISQAVKGERLSSGSRLFKDFVSPHDSNFVHKIRQAGFIFTGHTNTPEFGLKNITEPVLFGPTRSAWNATYSPGGSSGGAAAAITSGIVPVAGASDGGGSIRIPASFSGLFGLKPTRGRTPVGPGVGRQWQGASIDFVLSRSVRDSASMLDILQVLQPEAAFQTPLYPGSYVETMKEENKQTYRIAFTKKSPVGTPVSAEAVKAVEKTVKWLEQQGHIVEEKEPEVDGYQLMRNYFLMNSGEMSSLVRDLEQAFGREMTPADMEIESWVLNQAGKSVSAAEFSASLSSWDIAAAQMADFHQTYDFYVTPAAASIAPKVGELTHDEKSQANLLESISIADSKKQQEVIWDMFLPSLTYTPFTQLANLTGQPAMSVPVHVTAEENMPIGVQFIASKGMEPGLLQMAYQLEQSELWVGMKGNPYFK